MSPRDRFLRRVRQAVREGNRTAAPLPLPERGGVGYQGAGPDAIDRFCREMQAAGGFTYRVHHAAEAWQAVYQIIRRRDAHNILLSKTPLLDRLGLQGRLHQAGLNVHLVGNLTRGSARDVLFQADVGITGVAFLVAETGTLIMASGPDEPRSSSLLPPVHIAVAEPRQILPDLFDLFDLFSPTSLPGRPSSPPPSCLSLITGPSKTGDIELRLVTGVHGPAEVHVVLVE